MSYKVNVEVELSDQFLYDVLTCAAEGGIGYWAGYETDRSEDLSVRVIDDIYDIEGDDEDDLLGRGHVNIAHLLIAIQQVVSGETNLNEKGREHIIKAITEEDGICSLDCYDCDDLVQIALFGEVVYG